MRRHFSDVHGVSEPISRTSWTYCSPDEPGCKEIYDRENALRDFDSNNGPHIHQESKMTNAPENVKGTESTGKMVTIAPEKSPEEMARRSEEERARMTKLPLNKFYGVMCPICDQPIGGENEDDHHEIKGPYQ